MREYNELMAQQRAKQIRIMIFGVVVFLVLCIGIVLVTRTLFLPASGPTPTATPTATQAPATLTAVLAPLPTNTPTPTEMPSPTPVNTATPTSTPLPSPIPSSDPQADVVSYANLTPVEGVPDGVDIRAASVDADLRVVLQSTEGVPTELSGWSEDEVLLWIALYNPIPDPPTSYTEWLFVLDLDGDIGTGRPVGSLRTNPDLGIEVAVGAYYDPDSGRYEVYSLVWDPSRGSWADGPERLRLVLGESRSFVGLALPLEELAQSATQIAGVTLVPEAARGRSAALARVEGQRIIDFYPDRPGD